MLIRKYFIALALGSTAFTDQGITFHGLHKPIHSVKYGFVFPPTTAAGAAVQLEEFVSEITVPITNKWLDVVLGGQMVDNLLLVAMGTTIYSFQHMLCKHILK